ncbi:MAG: PEP-utilizing enzyme [Candidatus Woesearchaeota archaeon]
MIKKRKKPILEKLFERKSSFFIFIIALETNIISINKAVALKDGDIIFTYNNDTGIIYVNQEVIGRVNSYYLKLIENKPNIIRKLYKEGLKQNKLADQLIKKKGKLNYKNAIKTMKNNFLYSTVFPFWVLSGINSNLNSNNLKKYQNMRKNFEKLRSVSKYPILENKLLFPYFEDVNRKKIISQELVSFLTPNELMKIIDEREIPNEKEIEKRKICSVYYVNNKLIVREKNIFSNQIKKIPFCSKKEVTGTIANKGFAQGKVRIINSIEDMKGFKVGEILISFNTNPSLMPVISKSGAIVTDEGGIMCHASIVSRELNIPCVVGTKSATKIFKDGDIVEVNADKGIVRKVV